MTDEPKITLADGSPVTADHREIKPNGQQKDYIVLSKEERDKGFIRPVRESYVHIGRQICGKYGDNPEKKMGGPVSICIGKPGHDGPCFAFKTFMTQPEAAQAKASGRIDGCGGLTKMARSIAETYARDPKFYSGTFCVRCHTHRPLEQFVWDGTDEVVGS